MALDLIVVGDVMLDVSVEAVSLETGGDARGSVRVRPGGAGANAAVWAADAGATVRLHGRIGDDAAGHLVEASLAERGVESALAVDEAAPTGTMLVLRERGERSMVADRGANGLVSPADLPPSLEAPAVLVSGYLLFDPGSEAAGRAALERATAKHVAVDAATWPLLEEYGAERFLEATKAATLLLANEREARVLTGWEPEAAARELAAVYAAACVKLGAKGAVLASGDSLTRAPAPTAREADPTGAGDAFAGVLLATLARGEPRERALEEACHAGARAVSSGELWP